MPDDQKRMDASEIGRKLVGHSRAAVFTANRGLVVELFPFIFEASERMSARAISRYLLEEQNIKLSAVTITKGLNDPKKNWIAFFDCIERSAAIIAKWYRPASFKFLFKTKSAFEEDCAANTEGRIGRALLRGAKALLQPERAAAENHLREKWFTIGLATRLKAKSYLEEHL